jgi:oligosaccharide repeat unit polymerase
LIAVISILIIGVGSIFLGRWVFGAWFNHVSLYSGIWSLSISFFELGLIKYYPLESETWLLIIGAWIAFMIGSLTIVAARYALRGGTPRDSHLTNGVNLIPVFDEALTLNRLLWILNFFTLIVALQHWYVVIQKFGSVANVFIWANILRTALIQDEIPGMIPYADSLALSACLLSGLYTASIGKLKTVAVMSLIIVVLVDVASMGRAKMIFAGILFLCGYIFSRRRRGETSPEFKSSKLKRAITIGLAGALLLFGVEVVRSYRGVIENIGGASKSLEKLRGGAFITPSIYMYFTVSHGVFNQYLKSQNEKTIWGQYTFAPFWRALSKLGFDTRVRYYQPFYMTPIFANTGTYLFELHMDFGLAGDLIVPYLLGSIASLFWIRTERGKRLVDLVILGHIFVVVIMSFSLMATGWGYWLLSLCMSIAIAFFLDRWLIISSHKVQPNESAAISAG